MALTDTEVNKLKPISRIGLANARKIHSVARELVEFGKHPSTLLDNQMIVEGFSIKEIENKAAAARNGNNPSPGYQSKHRHA
ncbi:MAG: hypothetical protein QX199_05515 [Methylococcaceae bacterium]